MQGAGCGGAAELGRHLELTGRHSPLVDERPLENLTDIVLIRHAFAPRPALDRFQQGFGDPKADPFGWPGEDEAHRPEGAQVEVVSQILLKERLGLLVAREVRYALAHIGWPHGRR